MKEAERIAGLLQDIYNGVPWLDVTWMGTLDKITAEKAAKKVAPQWNSIWEIVNHIIRWRQNVLQRVQGSLTKSPADNYFAPITNQSEKEWQNTLQDLEKSQEEWIAFLQKMNDVELEKIHPDNNSSYYKNIHGIIQHDAYHLGQVVLLAKKTDNL